MFAIKSGSYRSDEYIGDGRLERNKRTPLPVEMTPSPIH